jgi:hypothetical protein
MNTRRVLLVLGLVSMIAPARAGARTFGDSIGINVKFSQGEPASDLPLLKKLGVRWVRDSVDWTVMEPVAGHYERFPQAFAQRLAFYKANHISLVFGLWYDNTRAYPNTPQQPAHSVDADAYGRYAAEITRQLNQSGVRFVIELYNEPHNSMKWLGGTWNGKPPSPWLDQYVRMVWSAVSQVKAVDPGVRLLANDDMWVIHYWYLEKGLPPALDGLSVHPYVKLWPEFSAVGQDLDPNRSFDLVDADRAFGSSVRRLRDRATAKLGHTPAIWATEWGWPLDTPVAEAPMSEDLLAGMIPRAFITSVDAGIEVLCWFSIQDSVDGPMGLIDNSGHQRKTFAAFATLAAELGAGTGWHHIAGAEHPTSGVQVYRFDTPAGNKLVAWDIDGNSSATLTNATGCTLRDALGQPKSIEPASTGSAVIPLSRSAVYISCLPTAVLTPQHAAGVAPTYLFP